MLIVLRVLSKLFRMLIVLLRVLQRTGATLQDAGDDQQRGDFVLCVFRSLKAKAEANALLSQVGVDDEETMRDMLNDVWFREAFTHSCGESWYVSDDRV